MKELAKALIRAGLKRLPLGANEVLFDAVCSRMGAEEVVARSAPRLNYLHLCADGKYGLMQGPLNDGLLLPTYGRTGAYDSYRAGVPGRIHADRPATSARQWHPNVSACG
jgi:hypothetical protein